MQFALARLLSKKILTSNGEKNNMKKTLDLREISEIVGAVSELVFVETDGVMDYHPEYLEATKAYYKILFYMPEMILENETIFDFYNRYLNGDFTESMNNFIDPIQSQYIDKVIDEKIDFMKKRLCNPVSDSLTKLINSVTSIINNQSNAMNGVQMNKLIKGISQISENYTAEDIANIFIDKKYPTDNKGESSTRKAKTTKPKTTEVK